MKRYFDIHPEPGMVSIMSETVKLSFEEALSQLENVVKRLEDPDVSLEESIELYEQGMKLSAFCNDTLEKATLRIEKLQPDVSGDQSPQ